MWDGHALKQVPTSNLTFASLEPFWIVPDGTGHMLALGYEAGFSWDGTRWSPTGSGCPTSTTSDALRQWQIAYDGSQKEIVAIGSREDGTAGMWRWEKGSGNPLASVSAPSGGHSSLTYDPELSGLVLTTFPIGGCCFDKGCGPPLRFP